MEPLATSVPAAATPQFIGVTFADGITATIHTGTVVVDAIDAGSFRVDGRPAAQPRHTIGKFGNFIKSDNPIHRFKRRIRKLLTQSWSAGELDTVVLCLEFIVDRPQDRKERHRKLRNKKPDVDNYCKAFLDAATKIVYQDDSVVAGVIAFKRYPVGDETTGVMARILWVPDDGVIPPCPKKTATRKTRTTANGTSRTSRGRKVTQTNSTS